ncbi:hypothetical protein V6Z11_A03G117200 [Gossypium hirsutum]
MAKPIPKKSARRILKGVIHVQACFNNTIVTIIDVRGYKKGDPFCCSNRMGNVIRAVVDQGMQRAEVMIKGPSLERDATLQAIRRSGILLSFVQDVTPIPYNGCRPPKKDVCRNTH